MNLIAECKCPKGASFLQHKDCGFNSCEFNISGDCDWSGWNEVLNAKPTCQLTGTDGNVFAIIGKVSATLKDAGQIDKAADFTNKAFMSGSYDEVLRFCRDYVEVR